MSSGATPMANTAPLGLTDPTQRRFRGSAKISEYEIMKEKLGEGTFGIVSKAKSRRTGNVVALKKILMHNEKDGFPITALREVKLLKMLSHPNILRLEEMAVERQPADEKAKAGKKRATLYMVMPYMDHDLSGMLTNPDIQFQIPQIKCYMLQLLEGLRYLHDSHILHRDMKAANILISNSGILQIADFGLARHYEGQTPQPGRGNGDAVRDYTSLVVTRWYRPPELLLALKRYTPAIDMWGVGCIFGEMFEKKPILEGRSDVDQCVKIFKLIGSPNDQTMPGWSELPGCEGHKDWESHIGDIDKRFARFDGVGREGLSLLKSLLCLDWRKRINAIDALQHEYFKVKPLPVRPDEIPKYEDSHELDSRRRGNQEKQRAVPPAPAGGTVGMRENEWDPYQDGYGDRGGRGYGGRDQGPPGAYRGPRGYDDWRGLPAMPAGRQPTYWDHDRGTRPMPANGHPLPPRPDTLPPRPPAAADRMLERDVGRGPDRSFDRGSDRGPPPPRAGGRDNVDTYIPSYQSGAPPPYDSRPPRDMRDPRDGYDRSRRDSREQAYRDGDRRPRDPYRGPDAPASRPYRDADRPGIRGDPYRDGRDRDRGYSDQRRTRSRSPERERRERLQNRERELYRR